MSSSDEKTGLQSPARSAAARHKLPTERLSSDEAEPTRCSELEPCEPTADAIEVPLGVDLCSRGMIKLYGVWSVAFLATYQSGYAIAAMTAIKCVLQRGL